MPHIDGCSFKFGQIRKILYLLYTSTTLLQNGVFDKQYTIPVLFAEMADLAGLLKSFFSSIGIECRLNPIQPRGTRRLSNPLGCSVTHFTREIIGAASTLTIQTTSLIC
ncbi:hypothetical protein H0G86_009296 [Trichoderma simmonsii]|uniref:Uncharacterized protein n=1 Tax=Trichoderma simmonsii TaxID=1491479 RepID=A0A8G0PMU5_9HYPO|nr:hypothetical protein H0G86_009296 [Trichoderma simmonsii]